MQNQEMKRSFFYLYLPILIFLTLLVLFIVRVAAAPPSTSRYLLQEQPMFTVKFTPAERSLEVFLTGKPLVKAEPKTLTVVARQNASTEKSETQLLPRGEKFVLPEKFSGKSVDIQIKDSGDKQESFHLEIAPQD